MDVCCRGSRSCRSFRCFNLGAAKAIILTYWRAYMIDGKKVIWKLPFDERETIINVVKMKLRIFYTF